MSIGALQRGIQDLIYVVRVGCAYVAYMFNMYWCIRSHFTDHCRLYRPSGWFPSPFCLQTDDHTIYYRRGLLTAACITQKTLRVQLKFKTIRVSYIEDNIISF